MNLINNPKQHLQKNLNNPSSPVSFLGVNKLYKFYDGSLTKKEIKSILSSKESYTLLRQKRKSKKYNYTISHCKRDTVQSDLVFVTSLAQFNRNVAYLLTVIDTYTKKLWVEGITDKTSESVMIGLKHIFERMGTLPANFVSDRGLEFKSKIMTKLMKKYKMNQAFTATRNKASTVERVQRTLQNMIFSYIVENQNYKYIDVLEHIVNTYNNTFHVVIKMTPMEAENGLFNEDLANAHGEKRKQTRVKKVKPKFKIGDKVRTLLKNSIFRRGYDVQRSHQHFIVKSIDDKQLVPVYVLEDERGKIQTYKYKEDELVPIKLETYRGIVKKSRIRNGRPEVLMSFTDYNDSWNEWIPESDTKSLSNN